MWSWRWRLWIILRVSCASIGGFWSQFYQIDQLLECLLNKYNSILAWPWYRTKVSFDVKCVAEDSWITFCLSLHLILWGILAQFPPHCSDSQHSTNRYTTWIPDGFETRVTPHWMWNVEVKTLNYFLCAPLCGLGYFGSVFPNLVNVQIP